MKKTPFFNFHLALGAKMVEFAGFNMPLDYSGINNEHLAVRKSVGIFDVSHMGEIWIKGKEALTFLQYITTNDVSKLSPGKAQYSCLPNGKGGIVDDIILYCFEERKYFLVANASNTEKDYQWIVSQSKNFDVTVENSSENISQLAIQGPNARNVLQNLTAENVDKIKNFEFITAQFAGVDNIIISATGYTGAGGFELYFYKEYADKIWESIFKAGKDFNILPIGLAARDTLRLEKGYMLYGNDIDDTTSPIEAGLSWIVKFGKDSDFIDKEFLLKQKTEGAKRKLIGFEMIDKGIPRHDYIINDKSGRTIGKVTSGTMSPSLKKGIGIGYVETQFANLNQEIFITIRNRNLKARVVKMPFL